MSSAKSVFCVNLLEQVRVTSIIIISLVSNRMIRIRRHFLYVAVVPKVIFNLIYTRYTKR